jgi:predicted cupin superfamily sugar epimerase
MQERNADYFISELNLIAHPEGGYFREVYRSEELIPGDALPYRYSGSRAFSTVIYFLLKSGEPSRFHRLQSDEIWHFYAGSSLTIHQIVADGEYLETILGGSIESGESYQAVIHEHTWFAAEVNQADSYSLIGCTVAPGFDFADFELGERVSLLAAFPQHEKIIRLLTK